MSPSIVDRIKNIEYAGWGFFLFFTVLFAGPGIWIAWESTYEGSISTGVRIVLGLTIAVVTAGFATYILNEILHRRNVRRYEAERQQERKAAKKTSSKRKGKKKK